MTTIDLDDLPPTVARTLETLTDGEEIAFVRGGLTVLRLRAETPTPATADAPETDMAEVMEQFGHMIEDEF